MVYKLLAETEEENLYICDGKNDELHELCKWIIWNYQMLSQIFIELAKRFARLKNHGANDTTVKKEMQVDISCYWWVCCIKVRNTRKNFEVKSMTV